MVTLPDEHMQDHVLTCQNVHCKVANTISNGQISQTDHRCGVLLLLLHDHAFAGLLQRLPNARCYHDRHVKTSLLPLPLLLSQIHLYLYHPHYMLSNAYVDKCAHSEDEAPLRHQNLGQCMLLNTAFNMLQKHARNTVMLVLYMKLYGTL